MASKKIKNIKDIYEIGGNSMQMAIKLGLTQASVEAWALYGIPRKHWPALLENYQIPLESIYLIDEEIRNENTK